MKIALILSFLLLIDQPSKGQPLGNINSYLKNPQIPDVAKLYYAGKFNAGDNDSTYSIIDSLETKNNTTRPFYLLLASKMTKTSDGALSEGLYPACMDVFEKHPDNLIEFLYDKKQKSDLVFYWANAIAQEIELSAEDEKPRLTSLKKVTFKKCKPKNRKNIELFFNQIKKELK